MRLVPLLVVLIALLIYAVASRPVIFGGVDGFPGVGAAAPDHCPWEDAPPVATVSRAELRGLREDLRRIVFFDRDLRPYEQGVAASVSAWTDSEPGVHNSLPKDPRVSGGYEMRWWMVNGDDVGADVMVFTGTGEARDFFGRATSPRCRPASDAFRASFPPGGRNLVWRNPDGFAQEDLFLLRGRKVYRIAVVKAGAGGSIEPADRGRAFSLVNALACALPEARCDSRSLPGVSPAALRESLDVRRERVVRAL